jgi:hypothetical protein
MLQLEARQSLFEMLDYLCSGANSKRFRSVQHDADIFDG